MVDSMRLLLLIILLVQPVLAKAEEYSGVLILDNIESPLQSVAYLNKKVSLNFDIQINWKLWTLLGEPVIDSHSKWIFNSVTIRDGYKENTYRYCDGEKGYHCLPASVINNIKLIDVEFLGQAGNYGENITYGIILNPGVNGVPGLKLLSDAQASYNTPGSPGWDRTLLNQYAYHDQHIDLNKELFVPEYIDADIAQDIVKKGVALRHLMLTKFSAGYSAIFSYLHECEVNKAEAYLRKVSKVKLNSKIKQVKADNEDDIFSDFETELMVDEEQIELEQKMSVLTFERDSKKKNIEQLKQYELDTIEKVRQRVDANLLPGEKVLTFNEGGLLGYKTSQGKVIIKPRFEKAGEFVDGKAKVEFDSYYEGRCSERVRYWTSALINKSGEYVSVPKKWKRVVGEFCLSRDSLM